VARLFQRGIPAIGIDRSAVAIRRMGLTLTSVILVGGRVIADLARVHGHRKVPACNIIRVPMLRLDTRLPGRPWRGAPASPSRAAEQIKKLRFA
jgi:hypothetical protein